VYERRVEVRTPTLQRTLTDLLLWARELDVELDGLDARSASLEEVFLRIEQDAQDDDDRDDRDVHDTHRTREGAAA
jgi:ABC-2 type transport system ATP-binding protein